MGSATPPSGSAAAVRKVLQAAHAKNTRPDGAVPDIRAPIVTRQGMAPAKYLTGGLEALSSPPPRRVTARSASIPEEPADAPAGRATKPPALDNPFDPPQRESDPALQRRSAPGLAEEAEDDADLNTAIIDPSAAPAIPMSASTPFGGAPSPSDDMAHARRKPGPTLELPVQLSPRPRSAPRPKPGPTMDLPGPPPPPPAQPEFLVNPLASGMPEVREPPPRAFLRNALVGAAAGIALFAAGFWLGRATAGETQPSTSPEAQAPTAVAPANSAAASDPRSAEPVTSPSPESTPAPTTVADTSASPTEAEPPGEDAPADAETAYVEISTRLEDTHLYVDGNHVGPTSGRMKVPCGLHHVRLGTKPPLEKWLSRGKTFVFKCGETAALLLEQHVAVRKN